jgi:hypothetical protein
MKRHLAILALFAGLATAVYSTFEGKENPVNETFSEKSQEGALQTAGGDYDTQWRKVDSLLDLNLAEDALNMVLKLYQQAKGEANQPHQVKAVLYVLKISDLRDEASDVANFNRLKNEIKASDGVMKYVLQSILAEDYQSFYFTQPCVGWKQFA